MREKGREGKGRGGAREAFRRPAGRRRAANDANDANDADDADDADELTTPTS